MPFLIKQQQKREKKKKKGIIILLTCDILLLSTTRCFNEGNIFVLHPRKKGINLQDNDNNLKSSKIWKCNTQCLLYIPNSASGKRTEEIPVSESISFSNLKCRC